MLREGWHEQSGIQVAVLIGFLFPATKLLSLQFFSAAVT